MHWLYLDNIYLDEFGEFSGTYTNILKNQSNGQSKEWNADLSYFYEQILNSYPTNVTSFYYHWDDEDSYFNCPSRYSEYPRLFSSVSSAGLDNVGPTYYPPYNVTKNFAHLCPAGATVYITSGDDSDIKQVSCKKGNMYSIIVINTGTEAKNITLNMSMTNGTVVFPYSNLVNYEDDTTTYKVNDGVAQLGVIDSYEILYLYSGVEDGALLRGVFKLNEGSGNTIYDSLQNLSNGVKSGATWVTDGILNALTNVVDYTYTYAGVFTVNNSDYYFEYLSKIFTFQGYTVAGNIVVALIQGTASFGDFWEIIVLALVIVIVLAFLIRALGTSNKR